MKQVKKAGAQKASPKLRPTLTPEAREKRLMSLALDVAEQRLLDGTASSQLVTTILKISTERESWNGRSWRRSGIFWWRRKNPLNLPRDRRALRRSNRSYEAIQCSGWQRR